MAYAKKKSSLPPLPKLISENMKEPLEANVNLIRSIYDQESFDFHHKLVKKNKISLNAKLRNKCDDLCSTRCDRRKLMTVVRKYLPFIGIMRHYKWRKWFTGDLISGISCGTVHIPQSLGYATLIGLPAVYGLYSSFFPLIIYFFFGTSHHLSIGTVAVVGLIVNSAITKQLPNIRYVTNSLINSTTISTQLSSSPAPACGGGIMQSFTTTSKPSSFSSAEEFYSSNSSNVQSTTLFSSQQLPIAAQTIDPSLKQEAVIMMVLVMTFVVGLMQFIMGLCHLGVIASFMSTPFNSAYQTAAAFHTAVSQLAGCLGYSIGSYPGIFTLINELKDLFSNIHKTNAADIITAIVTLVVLVFLKEFINVKYAEKLPVPIPADLLVVIMGTLISFLASLNSSYCLKIVGNIPRGFPKPEVPVLLTQVDKDYYYLPTFIVHLDSSFILDCFAVAVVSYVMCMTMAKIFARKYRYALDDNQELVAYGLMNFISSFFHCFPVAQSPPRTMIFVTTGGMTQISGLISSVVVFTVIIGLGPLFYDLPKALLSMIIIVALFPLFKQFKELKVYWKVNKFDFVLWVATFLAVLILDLPTGLAVGIGWNLLTMCAQSFVARGYNLSSVDYTDLFIASQSYVKTKDFDGIFIFRYEADIFFANVANFKRQLFKNTVNPQRLQLLREKLALATSQDNTQQKPNIIAGNSKSDVNENGSTNLGFAFSDDSVTVTIDDNVTMSTDDKGENETDLSSSVHENDSINDKRQLPQIMYDMNDEVVFDKDNGGFEKWAKNDDKQYGKSPNAKPEGDMPSSVLRSSVAEISSLESQSTNVLQNAIRLSTSELKHVTISDAQFMKPNQHLPPIDADYMKKRRRISEPSRFSTPDIRDTPAAVFDAFYNPPNLDNIFIDEDDGDLNDAVEDFRSHISRPHILERRRSSQQMLEVHTVILDCGAVGYIDFNGLLAIRQLFEDYRDADVTFLLAGCEKFMLAKLKTSGIYDEWKHHIFPSIIDAALTTQIRQRIEHMNKSFQ